MPFVQIRRPIITCPDPSKEQIPRGNCRLPDQREPGTTQLQVPARRAISILALAFLIICPAAAASSYSGGYYFLSGEYPEVQSVATDSLSIEVLTKKRGPADLIVYGPFRTKFRADRAMKSLRRNSSNRLYFSQIFRL